VQLKPLLWLNPFIEDYNVLFQIKIQSRSRIVKQKNIVKKFHMDSLKSKSALNKPFYELYMLGNHSTFSLV